MATKNNFEQDLEKLMSSNNEEEVTENLLKIIKVYNIALYKDIIINNPLFKVIAPELAQQVLKELNHLRVSITSEITTIDSDISHMKKIEDVDFDEQIKRLKKLRNDCLLLIDEVDDKKSQLSELL